MERYGGAATRAPDQRLAELPEASIPAPTAELAPTSEEAYSIAGEAASAAPSWNDAADARK